MPSDLRDDALGRIGAGNANNIAAQRAANATPEPTTSDLAFGDYLNAKNDIYGKYSYLSGGPNWGLINQLNQQKKEKAQLYKTNRADVENMYGQLTSDVEADTANLQKSFDTSMQQAGQRTDAMVGGLSAELGMQNDRRTQAARQLGLENEMALSDYQSTGALNEAMGTLLAQNQNWQGLLGSQKATSLQQSQNVKAGVGNTQNQMTTAMKQTYDAVNENINNAIRSEKSRVAVRKLTDEGKLLMGIQTSKIKHILKTEAGLTKPEINKYIKGQQEIDDFINQKLYSKTYQSPETFDGKGPDGTKYPKGPDGYHSMMRTEYMKAARAAKAGINAKPMDQVLLKYGQLTSLTPGLVTGDYQNIVPGYSVPGNNMSTGN